MHVYDSKNLEKNKLRCDRVINSSICGLIHFNSKNKYDALYNEPYSRIVNKTVDLVLNELNISDPLDASIVFEYMLWNGFFSKNMDYSFSSIGRVNNTDNYAADIMLGRGVCLNNAIMLNDILQCMKITSSSIACSCFGSRDQIYKPDIQRKVINNERNFFIDKVLYNIFGKSIGNHVAVLIEYNDDLVVVDPTNLIFLSFNDFMLASDYNSSVFLRIKPFSTRILSDLNVEELRRLFFKTADECNKSFEYLNFDNIKDLYDINLGICNDNISLLNDFHADINSDIDVVCKTLKL